MVELLLQAAHLLEQLVGVVGRHLLGDLVVLLDQPLGVGHAVLDVAEHRLGLVQLGLLGEQAHGEAGHQARLAVGRLLLACHHPQQGRLAGAIRPHDADLRAGQERQRDVVEDDLVAVRLAHGSHLVDELRHVLQPTGTRRLPRHSPCPALIAAAGAYRRTVTVGAAGAATLRCEAYPLRAAPDLRRVDRCEALSGFSPQKGTGRCRRGGVGRLVLLESLRRDFGSAEAV